jgi:thiol-disulfide isomerase/thioredoxin
MKLRFLAVIGVIALVLLTTFGMNYKNASEQPVPAPSDAKTGSESAYLAPDFTLKTLQGESVTLSDYRGKAVYLNFWASWCPPCKEEMPEIQKFYDKNKDQIEVLTIAVAYQDQLKDIQELLAQNKFSFPVVLDESSRNSVTERYGVIGIPASFFIDKDGVIRAQHEGAMTMEMLEQGMGMALKGTK